MWLFWLFLEIFILTPLNWIIRNNYAIYDFHPIIFSETSIRHWRFDERKNEPLNLIYHQNVYFWMLCKVFILGQCIMTYGSLMKVDSIAECSPWSILQYFWPALSNNWSWKTIFGLFESGGVTQILLYYVFWGSQIIILNLHCTLIGPLWCSTSKQSKLFVKVIVYGYPIKKGISMMYTIEASMISQSAAFRCNTIPSAIYGFYCASRPMNKKTVLLEINKQ